MALDLVALGVRHQVMLEGLKAGQSKVLFNNILDLSNSLQNRLREVPFEDLGDMRKADLTILLADLKKIATKVFNFYLNNLIQWLHDYIEVDREFWQVALSADKETEQYRDHKDKTPFIIPLFERAPKPDAIFSFARNNPMGANGALFETFAKGFTDLAAGRIVQQTAKAFANVQTRNELIADLTKGLAPGSAANANKSKSLLDLLAKQGDAMQRTIIQHVAAATNMSTAATGYAQYLWVSVMDSHTTVICRDRNGNVYTYNEGPEPPAHIGCRSSTVPFDGTGPITMPTFTVWANGQSQEYMNAAFDGEVGDAYQGNATAIDLETFQANRGLIIA